MPFYDGWMDEFAFPSFSSFDKPLFLTSNNPFVLLERMLYISFESPPDFDTNPTLPGRYNLQAMMFSTVPAVSPILKAPAWIPPTVAGPMMTFPSLFAKAIILLTSLIGTPSAMITTCRRESLSKSWIFSVLFFLCEGEVRSSLS